MAQCVATMPLIWISFNPRKLAFQNTVNMAHTQFRLKLAKEEHYYWFMYLGSLNSGFDFRHSWIQEIKNGTGTCRLSFCFSLPLCLGSIIFSFLC